MTKETDHTVQFAHEGKAEVTLSKRKIARGPKAERKQKSPKKTKHYAMRDIETRNADETTQVFADLEQEERSAKLNPGEKVAPARMSRNRGTPEPLCPTSIYMRSRKESWQKNKTV